MALFKRKQSHSFPPPHWSITKKCLDLIFECAKSSFPNEFGGMLKTSEGDKQLITEIVLLPGTIAGESHALFQMHMRPIDFTVVGTVHSHPSPSSRPSEADKQLFSKYGKVHIIVGMPYGYKSWSAYDYSGKKITIAVV